MNFVNLLKRIAISPIVIMGIVYHKISGSTPKLIYSGFRRVFYLSNGSFNDSVSLLLSNLYPFRKSSKVHSKLLGVLDDTTLQRVNKEIKTNGFYIFPNLIPQIYIDTLVKFAQDFECSLVPKNTQRAKFIENNIIATKYALDEQDIIDQHVAQEIILDDGLIEIAGRYLNAKPINDLVSMWWSTNFSSLASNEAAQMYHFDMDRIKFLKFFIYLTDVNTDTGPHMYVKGSHKKLPKSLRRDGRFTDEEIKSEYTINDIIEIIGEKGTLVAVDTRGLHKGKQLLIGHRLIFQVEYANSTFGMNYGKLKLDENPCETNFKDYRRKNPRFFKRYFLSK